jgi:hypothetical protein
MCESSLPTKADPELVIDPDAVLADSVSSQELEPVARGHREIR